MLGPGGKQNQQVVTVPQTMMHKSNKMMNNYLKGSGIPTPAEMLRDSGAIFNKRMSTD